MVRSEEEVGASGEESWGDEAALSAEPSDVLGRVIPDTTLALSFSGSLSGEAAVVLSELRDDARCNVMLACRGLWVPAAAVKLVVDR